MGVAGAEALDADAARIFEFTPRQASRPAVAHNGRLEGATSAVAASGHRIERCHGDAVEVRHQER